MHWAIGFDLSYLSTSKVSPNDLVIVIIVIVIVIGEIMKTAHDCGIIAHSSAVNDCPFGIGWWNRLGPPVGMNRGFKFPIC